MADLRADPAQDRPGDLPVRLKSGDRDRDVVTAQRVVVELSPTAATLWPDAPISIPELSIAT